MKSELPTFIMPMTKQSRYVRTEELIELNQRATDHHMSRVFDPYELLNLDPNGIHILTRINIMFLPFARCEVAIKSAIDPFPVRGVLDLQDEWYDALPPVGEYIKALDHYEQNPRRAQ